jgi:aquaporin Z
MLPKFLAEAIGTFVLVLTIGLATTWSGVPAPLAIGIALMAVVYAGGHVSGAHYNPAVTIGVWLRGALPAQEIAPYLIAQFAGALLACFLTYKFLGVPLTVAPAEGVTALKAITGEGVYTFVLVYVILNVATHAATAGNHYFGLAIGGTVMAGAFALGGITGAAFNPAVGLAPALFAPIVGWSAPGLAWVYLVGPLLGGVAAAIVYKVMNPSAAAT